MQTLAIDFHSSSRDAAIGQDAVRGDRIDPKFLYVTLRQAQLWRQVFLRHSPIHSNPEFGRIYREVFLQIAAQLRMKKVHIVGLGCGTGLKELDLFAQMKGQGCEAIFTTIDVSRDLVVESAQKLIAAGAGHERSLVCDLAEAAFIAEWLGRTVPELPRVITFFGLVPNLTPAIVAQIFRAALRPGDVLLASAHLAPVDDDTDQQTAMQRVFPQYDNPETLAWLAAALGELGLQDELEAPEMKIGEEEGVPAFVATARWKSGRPPLHLFHSLRYTPGLFEEMMRKAGLEMECLAMTSCREEAIWAIRGN